MLRDQSDQSDGSFMDQPGMDQLGMDQPGPASSAGLTPLGLAVPLVLSPL